MYEEMASTRQSDQIGGGNIIEKAVLESKVEQKLILAIDHYMIKDVQKLFRSQYLNKK